MTAAQGCLILFRSASRCDILVNSAGATRAGAFLDLPADAWQDGIALKFFGCVNLILNALRRERLVHEEVPAIFRRF
jgi:NAD(P)-dependent dehydrogenase (short-subunit alcohol dehydrogenase family)